jgi:hypothetical protein
MPRTRNVKRMVSAVAVVLISLAVLATARGVLRLSQYPIRQAADLRRQVATEQKLEFDRRVRLETALLQYETDNRIKIWTAIIQAAGGTALLVGLLFTARSLRATQDKLEIDRQGQLTNRFIQATGQLGAELKDGQPNIEVRLGGIYTLHRIAKDWPKDYWPIADVLTAYVRHNAQWTASSREAQSKPTTDIQAILTVLGRDDPPEPFNDRRKLDLRNTDLRGAEFWDARLEYTDFWGAHLDRAELWGAVLCHAKFEEAHLAGANLRKANLENASLEGADLTGAVFNGETVWPTGFDARGRGAIFKQDT